MSGAASPSSLDLLTLASRAAFAARRKPGWDPFLLLTAARLARRVEVTELAMPAPIVRPLSEASPVGPNDVGDGLIAFEVLLGQAERAAGDEAKLVADLVRALRAMPPPTTSAWTWAGLVRPASRLAWQVRAPAEEAAQLMLAWSGSEGGRLEVGDAGLPLAEVCDRGAAGLSIAPTQEGLLVAIANPTRSPAHFALGFSWDPREAGEGRSSPTLPKP